MIVQENHHQYISEEPNQSSTNHNIPPFGNRPFQNSSTLSNTLKSHLGPEFLSERAGPGGRKVPYLEGTFIMRFNLKGWRVVENANDIFQFNGWSSEIKSQKIDFIDSSDGRHSVAVSSIIRVTLQDGTFREDVGIGLMENARSKGDAIEKAKKSSVTDGMKRALRLFGNVMGLSLSSKDYLKNIRKVPNPSSKPLNSENLYRDPGYFVRSKSDSILPSKKVCVSHLVGEKQNAQEFKIPSTEIQPGSSKLDPLTEDYLFNDDEGE